MDCQRANDHTVRLSAYTLEFSQTWLISASGRCQLVGILYLRWRGFVLKGGSNANKGKVTVEKTSVCRGSIAFIYFYFTYRLEYETRCLSLTVIGSNFLASLILNVSVNCRSNRFVMLDSDWRSPGNREIVICDLYLGHGWLEHVPQASTNWSKVISSKIQKGSHVPSS